MLMIHFCEECEAQLEEYGEFAHHIYQVASEFYIYNSEYFEMWMPSDCELKVVSFLERKGYIITTESNQELIKIKPLGIESVMDNEGFCFHICFDRVHHKDLLT